MFRKRRARKPGTTAGARQPTSSILESVDEPLQTGQKINNNNPITSSRSATPGSSTTPRVSKSKPALVSFQDGDDEEDVDAVGGIDLSLERRKAKQRREKERSKLRKRRPLAPLPPSAPPAPVAHADTAASRYSASNLDELRREAMASNAEAVAADARTIANHSHTDDDSALDEDYDIQQQQQNQQQDLSSDVTGDQIKDEDKEDAELLARVAQAKAARRLAVVQAQRSGGGKDPSNLVQMRASHNGEDEKSKQVREALQRVELENEHEIEQDGDSNVWEAQAMNRGRKATTSESNDNSDTAAYSDDADYTAVLRSLTSALIERKARVNVEQQALEKASSNLAIAQNKRGKFGDNVKVASKRYVFLQSTKEMVVGLSSCLRAKSKMITQIQDALFQIETEQLRDRHYAREVRVIDGIADAEDKGELFARGDAGRLPENVLDVIKTIVPIRQADGNDDDEFGRRRTYASARERSIRRRQSARRIANSKAARRRRSNQTGSTATDSIVTGSNETGSSGTGFDDEIHTSDDDSDGESDKKADRRKSIAQARELVFQDVVTDLSNMSTIISRFAEWKQAYPDDYDQAFVALALPELVAVYVQHALAVWDPTSTGGDIHLKDLFAELSAQCKFVKPVREEKEDVIVHCLTHVVLPRMTQVLQHSWDVRSRKQSEALRSTVTVILDAVDDVTVHVRLKEQFGSLIQQRIGEAERTFAVPVPADKARDVVVAGVMGKEEVVSPNIVDRSVGVEGEVESGIQADDPAATKFLCERQGIAAMKWLLVLVDCWFTGSVVDMDVLTTVLMSMLDKIGRLLKAWARSSDIPTKAISVDALQRIQTACHGNVYVSANAQIQQKLQGLAQALRV